MPYVNIKVTREGVTREQKAALDRGGDGFVGTGTAEEPGHDARGDRRGRSRQLGGGRLGRDGISQEQVMNAQTEFASVLAVMDDYFAGLHHSDTTLLRRAFHPEAHYACATPGTLLHWDMAHYFSVVDQRPSPASRGQAPQDRVLCVEFAGPVTALVRATCAIAPKVFTDFLILVKLEGRWQILSKVFHYELSDEQA